MPSDIIDKSLSSPTSVEKRMNISSKSTFLSQKLLSPSRSDGSGNVLSNYSRSKGSVNFLSSPSWSDNSVNLSSPSRTKDSLGAYSSPSSDSSVNMFSSLCHDIDSTDTLSSPSQSKKSGSVFTFSDGSVNVLSGPSCSKDSDNISSSRHEDVLSTYTPSEGVFSNLSRSRGQKDLLCYDYSPKCVESIDNRSKQSPCQTDIDEIDDVFSDRMEKEMDAISGDDEEEIKRGTEEDGNMDLDAPALVSTDNTYHLRLSESIKSLQSALNVQEHDMTPVEILSGGYTMPESPCPKGAQKRSLSSEPELVIVETPFTETEPKESEQRPQKKVRIAEPEIQYDNIRHSPIIPDHTHFNISSDPPFHLPKPVLKSSSEKKVIISETSNKKSKKTKRKKFVVKKPVKKLKMEKKRKKKEKKDVHLSIECDNVANNTSIDFNKKRNRRKQELKLLQVHDENEIVTKRNRNNKENSIQKEKIKVKSKTTAEQTTEQIPKAGIKRKNTCEKKQRLKKSKLEQTSKESFELLYKEIHEGLLEYQPLPRKRSKRECRENPVIQSRGCQTGLNVPTSTIFDSITPLYYRGRKGPVPVVEVGTQTESGILYETVTTPSQKVLGDVYVCRHCKFKGGSVWLTGDPIKDKSTSRCIPLCTELTPVLQTSFDTKILKRVESCVAMVTEFSARHYLEKGFDQQASSSGNHLDGSREEKLYVISPKLREKFQHLFNLYHQLKQLHVEQLFWRHASYLAISIETLERYLSQQFQTCAVLKYSIMKYRMSGVATFILGSLVVEINNVLYQIVRNSDSSRLVCVEGFGRNSLSYVNLCENVFV